MKKTVYIETSIVSFLTGKPSRNILSIAWQSLTAEWWEVHRKEFGLFISELVLEEARRGDSEAAAKRLEVLEHIPILDLNDQVLKLAKELIAEEALPAKAADDALHISAAVVHNMDYLLTWNCRHIDNAETKPKIREIITRKGYHYPEICTPQELLGGDYYEE